MAQRATSLGPKPSFFFFWGGGLLLFLSFLWFVIQRKLVFPLEKGIFCLFLSVTLCFSLAFLGLPLFQFLFLCLSLFFFSVFLPSCLSFLLSFGSLFLSLSFFFFLLCFSFIKGTTSKYSIASFFINIFFFWVSCLCFSFKSLFLILFFLLI